MIFYFIFLLFLLSISQGMRIYFLLMTSLKVFSSYDMKQGGGCGFVKLPNRDMVVAAIKALSGNYVSENGESSMKGHFFREMKNQSRA